jgi:hypothetical protein
MRVGLLLPMFRLLSGQFHTQLWDVPIEFAAVAQTD